MKTRIASLAATAIVAVALLSGCTGGPTISIAPEDLATTAANGLEEQIGSRPEIDCGTAPVELKKGKVVDCILTDPSSGEQFEAPVTITKVDGNNYSVSVKVADAPIGG